MVETAKTKVLIEAEVTDASSKTVIDTISKAAEKGVKDGINKALKSIDPAIEGYKKVITDVGKAVYPRAKNAAKAAEGVLGPIDVQKVTPDMVAKLAGATDFDSWMRGMYDAGFRSNMMHSEVRQRLRQAFGNFQPSFAELNIPLEKFGAKPLREITAYNKAVLKAQAASDKAIGLLGRALNPDNKLTAGQRIRFTQQAANLRASLSSEYYIKNGVFSTEEANEFLGSANSLREGVTAARETISESERAAASATQMLENHWRNLRVASIQQRILNSHPSRDFSQYIRGWATEQDLLGKQRLLAEKSASAMWMNRRMEAVASLTEPQTTPEFRQYIQDWVDSENLAAEGTQRYWSNRRRQAVQNINYNMDPEMRDAMKHWYKAQEGNTGAIKSLTSWLRSGAGGPFVTAATGGYFVGQAIGHVATGIMAGRTSWLADMQNPYSRQRDVIYDWAKSGGGVAGGLLGAALGSMILPGIGTFIGGALGTTGGMMFGQSLIDQKKIADEYAKYSGNLNIQRALYGENIGYNAANAVQNSNLASATDLLSLNATAAMMPGAFMFGGVSEQQMLGLSYLPNYWASVMRGDNPLDQLANYREDAKKLNPVAVPYLTSLAGIPENLRGLAMSSEFDQLYSHKDEWNGMDLQQFSVAMENSKDAINRAAISQRQLNTQFLEQSRATKLNGLIGELSPVERLLGIDENSWLYKANRELVTNALMGNGKLGDINIYIDGAQAAKHELKVEDWVGGMTIYSSGGQ